MKTRTYIENYKKKIVELSEIIRNTSEDYEDVAKALLEMIEQGNLVPVRASGQNGRRPALYNRYKIIRPDKDYSEACSSIRLLHARFNHQYYLNHPEQYVALKADIDAFSDFLWNRSSELLVPMSINERSFSIFGKEKLLKSIENQFTTIFRMQGFNWDDLNTYATPEPFFEYIHPEIEEGDILIIENKDTWYTLRKIMREENSTSLFGIRIRVLIYGEGKKITRQSGRLREYQEEVLGEGLHRFYYFGDLDYEGISIYQEAKLKNPEIQMDLLTPAYELMLEVMGGRDYPMTRDQRKPRANLQSFLSLFDGDSQKQILGILEEGKYIPQEVLNYTILRKWMKGNSHV